MATAREVGSLTIVSFWRQSSDRPSWLDMDRANNMSMRRGLNEVESVLKTRETYQELIIKKVNEKDEPILLLGGFTQEQTQDVINSNAELRPNFLGLKRMSLPPISRKHQDLSRYDEIIQPVIQSFFHDELKILWHFSDGSLCIEGMRVTTYYHFLFLNCTMI